MTIRISDPMVLTIEAEVVQKSGGLPLAISVYTFRAMLQFLCFRLERTASPASGIHIMTTRMVRGLSSDTLHRRQKNQFPYR